MESSVSPRDAQQRWQPVYQAYGDSEGAPWLLNGENGIDYRIRLMSKYQRYDEKFKDANLPKVAYADESVFTVMEDSIRAAAMRALRDPANFKRGVLIPQKITDGGGRTITKYIGEDGACWDAFNPPIRFVRRINVPGHA